jgi:hypothetical protein
MKVILTRARRALGLSLALASCAPSPAAPAREDSKFRLTASIRDLMDAEFDPSADVVWASVASISSAAGFEDRQPRTDEEWAEVRRKALTLVEATNLLVMTGRRVSATYIASRATGELDSTEVQKKIDASPETFEAFAGVLRDTGLKALAAVNAKNPTDLFDVGEAIDAACEACHVTYWYPDQATVNLSDR